MSNRLLIAHDYQSLRDALNHRRQALRMTMLELDERTGWADGLSGKIFSGTRNFGPETLSWALQALGVAICLVELPADGRTYKIKAIRRDAFLKKRTSELASRGGKARFAKMTAEERTQLARKAGKAAAAARARKRANAAKAARLHEPRKEYHRRRRQRAEQGESFPQG